MGKEVIKTTVDLTDAEYEDLYYFFRFQKLFKGFTIQNTKINNNIDLIVSFRPIKKNPICNILECNIVIKKDGKKLICKSLTFEHLYEIYFFGFTVYNKEYYIRLNSNKIYIDKEWLRDYKEIIVNDKSLSFVLNLYTDYKKEKDVKFICLAVACFVKDKIFTIEDAKIFYNRFLYYGYNCNKSFCDGMTDRLLERNIEYIFSLRNKKDTMDLLISFTIYALHCKINDIENKLDIHSTIEIFKKLDYLYLHKFEK